MNQAAAAGVDNAFNEMGVALGDIDADGWFDIYVTNLYGPGEWNTLFRRTSPGLQFEEIARELGVENGGCGWGAGFLDANHSGWLDLATTNSCAGDSSRFFRGVGNGRFADVSSQVGYDDTEAGSGLLEAGYGPRRGFGSAAGLWVPRRVAAVREPACGSGRDAELARGATAERGGGSGDRGRVRVTGAGPNQARVLLAGSSLLSQSPAEAHFGLGSVDSVDVRVEWVGGGVTLVEEVEAGQVLVLTDMGE